jgi:hypothetical protein
LQNREDKMLAADAFAAALEAVPAEDWCRTWAAGRTIMLRCTSKKVQEVVDKMRLPAVVRLSRSFWDDARNGTSAEKLQFVMTQLVVFTARCRITTLALPECEMNAQDAERLAGVLEQCPALARLDLRGDSHPNDTFPSCLGAEGAQSLGRVLRLCPALTYLNLSYNYFGYRGVEVLAGVLARCTALAHLELSHNRIGTVGRERLRSSWCGPGSALFL